MKLANCAESAHQFFFFSKLSLLHETLSCPTKKTILSESRMIEERRLHLVCSPRVCDRNRRSIKKRNRRDRNLPEQIGRSVFWLILLGRAKPLLSLRPLTGLTAVANPPASLRLDKSLTKWSFPLFRSANASCFNWTFNTLLCNPFSLPPSLQSTRPPVRWYSNGRIKRRGYFPFFLQRVSNKIGQIEKSAKKCFWSSSISEWRGMERGNNG